MTSQDTLLPKKSDLVPDSFGAFLVEGASFTPNEEYPILRSDMISSAVPKKILPFQKAIVSNDDLSETFICFYSPDKEFERVRRNPARYVSFFKKTAGIIGFDFSVHDDMPLVKQKSQINDNLSLTYYFASKGIPVIPNLRCGADQLMDEFFSAIPKKSTVAVGTHGFIKRTEEKCEWYCFLEAVITELEPQCIVVYGPLNGALFDNLKKNTRILCFPSWISEHWKEEVNHVN